MFVQVLLMVTLLTLFVVAWLLVTLRRSFGFLNNKYQMLQSSYGQLEQQEQARALELEQKREEFQKNKLEVAEKRKKAYELQEDMKKLRNDLRVLQQDLIDEQKKKTVFVEVEKRIEVQVPAIAPQVSPIKADPSTADLERYKLDADNAKKALQTEREAHHKLQQEMQRLRQKIEGSRRIELISKNKIELLEDKLKGLGRP